MFIIFKYTFLVTQWHTSEGLDGKQTLRSRTRSTTTLWLCSMSCTYCSCPGEPPLLLIATKLNLFPRVPWCVPPQHKASQPVKPHSMVGLEVLCRGPSSPCQPCKPVVPLSQALLFAGKVRYLGTLLADTRGYCPRPLDPPNTWQNTSDIWWANQHFPTNCLHHSQ